MATAGPDYRSPPVGGVGVRGEVFTAPGKARQALAGLVVRSLAPPACARARPAAAVRSPPAVCPAPARRARGRASIETPHPSQCRGGAEPRRQEHPPRVRATTPTQARRRWPGSRRRRSAAAARYSPRRPRRQQQHDQVEEHVEGSQRGAFHGLTEQRVDRVSRRPVHGGGVAGDLQLVAGVDQCRHGPALWGRPRASSSSLGCCRGVAPPSPAMARPRTSPSRSSTADPRTRAQGGPRGRGSAAFATPSTRSAGGRWPRRR